MERERAETFKQNAKPIILLNRSIYFTIIVDDSSNSNDSDILGLFIQMF